MSEDAMNDMFLEAMKQDSTKKSGHEGRNALVQGKVVAVNKADIFMDLGGKSECVVPVSEFTVLPKVGDIVDVVLKEMKDGVNIGSKLDADKIRRQNDIKKALEDGMPVTGTIEDPIYKDKVPKGFNVNLGYDIKAFLPLSQIDTKKDEKLELMKGTVTDFAVIEMKRNNITVSRREFLFKTIKKLYTVFFEKFKVGDILKGKVERVEEDFIVLTVEGIRAFMHVSDFSWKYLNDMKKVVKIGDEMEVMVNKLDPAKNSVKVGKKQLTPDPWLEAGKKYSVGAVVKGKVVNFRKEGAIIEVEDGIEAFLPVEEMSWTEKVRDPKRIVNAGAIVQVKILGVDADRRRMEVSLREIQENPWDKAVEKYPVGKKVNGVITSIVDFGVFVKLDDGIEGLMRKDDVDWMESTVDLKTRFKKGETVQAMILALDSEKEKLRLGYKQLSDNPVKLFSMNYPKGSVISATVKEIQENGAVVSLENNLEGYIHISQISKDKVEKVGDALKVGDEVKALIKFVDGAKNKIELSIRDFLMNEEKIEVEKYMATDVQESGGMMMGNLLKDQLANIKVEKKDATKKSK